MVFWFQEQQFQEQSLNLWDKLSMIVRKNIQPNDISSASFKCNRMRFWQDAYLS